MRVDVYVAMAFSKNNTGGNGAGVVLNAKALSNQDKMNISKQLGFSETAFVQPSSVADFKMEYFTPTDEVDLCGHATIATFSVLYHLNKIERKEYTIETKAGILSILVQSDGMIQMQQNIPVYYEVLDPSDLKGCLTGISSLPIQIVSTGLKDIMIPIQSRKQLDEMVIDFEVMKEVSKQYGVIGMHAFCLDSNVDAIVRNFAPLYGIDEESATGTANCALASYLYKYKEKKKQYVFEQGHHLNSVSRIVVNIDSDQKIEKIMVGGYGYIVKKTVLST